MNILAIGFLDNTVINAIKASEYLEKLYIAAPLSVGNIPNIDFTDFDDLIKKAKLLKTDIAITFDKDLIQAGITEEFKKNRLNIISVNKKWLNLENSKLAAKKLLNHYNISNPKFIKAPVDFPVVLKTDNSKFTHVSPNMEDLIENFELLRGESFFTEEFLPGDCFEFIHIWDGENLFTIPPCFKLSEVQEEKLKIYSTKMNFMLSDEKADFMGFFRSKLIWAKNDWFVLNFKIGLDKYLTATNFKKDFLFILNCTIYRTLNDL